MTKSIVIVLAVPLFAFLAAAATLNLGALLPSYRDFDQTLYLAARSLSADHDLAYSKEDSDRYFRENLRRPSGFLLAGKSVISSEGGYKKFPVFYVPEIFVFILTPFVGMFHFHGWLLLHALLIGCLYAAGYLFYHSKNDDSALPALNSVAYFTLVPVPILFLLPTHHLFLLTILTISVFLGLRRKSIWSAFFLALAFSSQPGSLIIAGFLAAYWHYSGTSKESARFGAALLLFCAAVWGTEVLMYPGTPEVRQVGAYIPKLDSETWAGLPQVRFVFFRSPDLQGLADFVFGRSYGFAVYGTAAVCLLLAAVWRLSDPIARSAVAMSALILAIYPFIDPSISGSYAFVNDFWLMLAVVPFFAIPLARPSWFFATVVVLSSLTAGPLLANPLGAFTSRNYYVQSFPYRLFPQELSTLGKSGITADPAFKMSSSDADLYFLNDSFHPEPGFFWVHGESTLEWIVVQNSLDSLTHLQIRNGAMENRITVNFGGHEEFLALGASESSTIPFEKFRAKARLYKGRYYLHGTIKSSSGYVPKLLSRENQDYRYLGCQVQLIGKNTQLGAL